jgi:hydrogenase expression/formation protein HypC
MCLAVPETLINVVGDDFEHMGEVNFGDVMNEVRPIYVPEAQIGDYVIAHVGFAPSRIDGDEARRVFDSLEETGELGEKYDG